MRIKSKGPAYIIKGVVIPFFLFAVLGVLLILCTVRFGRISDEQGRELTLSAIRKAAVQCYADEGRFPPHVDYLSEHYGVEIDTDKYNVTYDCLASNVFPNIAVYSRSGR